MKVHDFHGVLLWCLSLVALLWLGACATPESLCAATLEQYQSCGQDFTDPDDEPEFMDECQEWYEEAGDADQRCYDALVALAKCINGLSCGDWDEYWDGIPSEDTSYPCAAEDVDFYLDDTCT